MAGHELDAKRIANLAKELVSTAENREFFVVIIQGDRDFGHTGLSANSTQPGRDDSLVMPAGLTDSRSIHDFAN